MRRASRDDPPPIDHRSPCRNIRAAAAAWPRHALTGPLNQTGPQTTSRGSDGSVLLRRLGAHSNYKSTGVRGRTRDRERSDGRTRDRAIETDRSARGRSRRRQDDNASFPGPVAGLERAVFELRVRLEADEAGDDDEQDHEHGAAPRRAAALLVPPRPRAWATPRFPRRGRRGGRSLELGLRLGGKPDPELAEASLAVRRVGASLRRLWDELVRLAQRRRVPPQEPAARRRGSEAAAAARPGSLASKRSPDRPRRHRAVAARRI